MSYTELLLAPLALEESFGIGLFNLLRSDTVIGLLAFATLLFHNDPNFPSVAVSPLPAVDDALSFHPTRTTMSAPPPASTTTNPNTLVTGAPSILLLVFYIIAVLLFSIIAGVILVASSSYNHSKRGIIFTPRSPIRGHREDPPQRPPPSPVREEEDDGNSGHYDGDDEGEPPDGDPDGQDDPPKLHPRSQFPHTWRDWLLAILLMVALSELLHLICPTDVKRNRRRLIRFGRTIIDTTVRLFDVRAIRRIPALHRRLRLPGIVPVLPHYLPELTSSTTAPGIPDLLSDILRESTAATTSPPFASASMMARGITAPASAKKDWAAVLKAIIGAFVVGLIVRGIVNAPAHPKAVSEELRGLGPIRGEEKALQEEDGGEEEVEAEYDAAGEEREEYDGGEEYDDEGEAWDEIGEEECANGEEEYEEGVEWDENEVISSLRHDYDLDFDFDDTPSWHIRSEVEGEWAEDNLRSCSVQEALQDFADKYVVALETIPEEEELSIASSTSHGNFDDALESIDSEGIEFGLQTLRRIVEEELRKKAEATPTTVEESPEASTEGGGEVKNEVDRDNHKPDAEDISPEVCRRSGLVIGC
ncbi:hypothetical protein DXG03_003362 [Asterophora parasitica]|uniref:Uncharacterized protein n=1 Tax=Asterophora parasitica TaxID=117018 RepID=A0A9P7K9G9_9AGAR|nr:hypothetical protein DXG03_003362 [Asterophora parasitica]